MFRLILLFSLVGIVLTSSGQSADVLNGCAPLEVKFAASETSATFYWDFKDGNVSIRKNPINVFNKPGKYKVEFREGQTGPILKTIDISVFESPDLGVKAVKGCLPFNSVIESVSKIDPEIAVQKYTWVFGDGMSQESTAKNISHTYNQLGKFSVSLGVVTGFPSCNKTAISDDAVEVINGPRASFITNPLANVICDDVAKLTFTNSSTGGNTLAYKWSLGNGASSTEITPAAQTYKKGKATITLDVSYKDLPQCVSQASKTISVGKIKPNIFSASLDKMACANGNNYMIHTDFVGKLDWTFSNGVVVNSGLGDTLFVSFSKGGMQQIKLTATDMVSGCSSDSTYNREVDDLGLAENTFVKLNKDKDFSCNEPFDVNYSIVPVTKPARFYWSINEKIDSSNTSSLARTLRFTLGKKNSVYDENKEELNDVFVIAQSTETGCLFGSNLTTVKMQKPNARFKVDVSQGCVPINSKFKNFSWSKDTIVKWLWVFGDGNSLVKSDTNSVSHQYTSTGNFDAQLIVTTKAGCVDSSYKIPVKVGTQIANQLDFAADKLSVCQDETVTLSVTKDIPTNKTYHFSSTDTKFFHCPDEKVVPVTFFNSAGLQDVSLTVDYNGCLSTITKTNYVDVKGPLAKLDYNFVCNDPYNYRFISKSLNATNVLWKFQEGKTETTSSDVSTTKLYTESGNYTATLTASNGSGCSASVETVTVYPRKIKAVLNMDTTLCQFSEYNFSGGSSIDVHAQDHLGYTWNLLDLDSVPYKTSNSLVFYALTKRGRQRLMLEVEDINGCKDSTTKFYTVYGADLKLRTNVSAVCNPGTVEFTDSTKSDAKIVSWNWGIDGSILSGKTVSYTYNKAPVDTNFYASSLVLRDSIGCFYRDTIRVNHYKPDSKIKMVDPSLCLGDTAEFFVSDSVSIGAGLTHKWDFGNGKTSIKEREKVFYPKDSIYRVKLVYEQIGSKCIDSTTLNVGVHEYPTAYITTNIDTVKVLCAPLQVLFKDSSYSRKNHPLLYNWNFDNGQLGTTKSFALSYKKGKYTTRLITSTFNGCADTAYTKEYNVLQPEGNFSTDKSLICKGESILFTIKDTADVGSFSWNFGDGIKEDEVSPVAHQFNSHPPTGTAFVTLFLLDKTKFCRSTFQRPISIRQVIADFTRLNGKDSSICIQNSPFKLTNTSKNFNSFMWDFGDGNTSSTTITSHNFEKPGPYVVKLSVGNNTISCKDTIRKTIIVYATPDLRVVGDTACLGDTLQLKVLNSSLTSEYGWFPKEGLNSQTSTSPVAKLNNSTKYTVTEIDVNGCIDTMSVWAYVVRPIALANWDTSIVIGDKAILPVKKSTLNNFNWSPTNGLSCIDCDYPSVQPLSDITYRLKVTDILNCFNDDFEYKIIVRPETFIKMPTAFSPNGDGANDLLEVKGWGIKELLYFQIYNRWGELVYESTDLEKGWDGTFKGKPQNSDVYTYKVKVKTWRENEDYTEGYVNLFY